MGTAFAAGELSESVCPRCLREIKKGVQKCPECRITLSRNRLKHILIAMSGMLALVVVTLFLMTMHTEASARPPDPEEQQQQPTIPQPFDRV
ncbi:MAG TPA: hypothetical protein VMH81_23870 [Bryobacteraceae bacterium]|nr:hypothetical protein [Bryobacteraceae bacterium]